jgi:predicted phosphodiesterase
MCRQTRRGNRRMKIQIASDLHLDLLPRMGGADPAIIEPTDADMLVLAGDIHDGCDGIDRFQSWKAGADVIYVAGNHEYYGHVYRSKQTQIQARANEVGIHFLERSSVVLEGVRFLGATLWTDYRLFEPRYSQPLAMHEAKQRLNDHRLIRMERGAFSPADALAIHAQSRQWLKEELTKPFDGKTVVVTHHGPHPNSVHEKYKDDFLSAAFVSDLGDLLQGADLWIHGHVHDSFHYQIGRCRVIANPAGYVLNRRSLKNMREAQFENSEFNPRLIVEI